MRKKSLKLSLLKKGGFYKTRVRIAMHQNELHHKLLIASAFVAGSSTASCGKKILKDFFNSQSQSRLAFLLETWNKMTPEQREHPGRIRD